MGPTAKRAQYKSAELPQCLSPQTSLIYSSNNSSLHPDIFPSSQLKHQQLCYRCLRAEWDIKLKHRCNLYTWNPQHCIVRLLQVEKCAHTQTAGILAYCLLSKLLPKLLEGAKVLLRCKDLLLGEYLLMVIPHSLGFVQFLQMDKQDYIALYISYKWHAKINTTGLQPRIYNAHVWQVFSTSHCLPSLSEKPVARNGTGVAHIPSSMTSLYRASTYNSINHSWNFRSLPSETMSFWAFWRRDYR